MKVDALLKSFEEYAHRYAGAPWGFEGEAIVYDEIARLRAWKAGNMARFDPKKLKRKKAA